MSTLRAGFDIGGTNARVSLFDTSDDYAAVAQARARHRDDTTPEAIGELMRRLLAEACAAAQVAPQAVEAIGVGLAAQLSADGAVVINAPNLGWRDLPIEAPLRAALGFTGPLRVVNDLNALVVGEHVRGAVRGVSDVLAVYAGTGVGGAIIANHKLIEGAGGKAGEVGHVKVDLSPEARLCGCGQYGCVEAYAGGVHLERLVAAIVHAHPDDPTLAALIDPSNRVDLGAADRMADAHPAIDALWTRAASLLALVMANACTLLNPSVLLLGGGVLENCRALRQRLLERVTPPILAAARDDLEIRMAALGDDAGMLGAASLA